MSETPQPTPWQWFAPRPPPQPADAKHPVSDCESTQSCRDATASQDGDAERALQVAKAVGDLIPPPPPAGPSPANFTRGDVGAALVADGIGERLVRVVAEGLQATLPVLNKAGEVVSERPDWATRYRFAALAMDRIHGSVPARKEVLMVTRDVSENKGLGAAEDSEEFLAALESVAKVTRRSKRAKPVQEG